MSLPRETLARYLTEGCCFVETGTRFGDTTIAAMQLGAESAFTCESDRIMAAIATQHIEDVLRSQAVEVQVFDEDSPAFLRFRMDPAERVVLFLDAHSDGYSPILDELKAVRELWPNPPVIILIDDVRLFRSKQWGVSLDDVLAAVRAVGDYEISYDTGIQPEDVLVARLRK